MKATKFLKLVDFKTENETFTYIGQINLAKMYEDVINSETQN